MLKLIPAEKWRSGLNLQSGQGGTMGIKELFEGLKSVTYFTSRCLRNQS